MTDPLLGTSVLGRYRIVARLAAGGMGVVYLARAEGAAGFAKPMVVKRVLPDLMADARMKRLFVREAKILSNLQHPNIVGVTDFGEEDGAYIMVLDYVRAYHLGLWLDYRREHKQQMPVAGVVYILIKVLDALEYAHGLALPDGSPLEIVHGDISPANVLVDTDGQVKLLDFGIARMKGEQTQTTDSKSIRGKLGYLPIEALDGSPATTQTDVYACGVTLYELLVGENPFVADDETRTLARVISFEPPPPRQVRPDISPELEAITMRAMSKDRTKRFASAKEFARELRKVLGVPEDEIARSLAALAKSDYAAMPEWVGRSLSELEDLWRTPGEAKVVARPSAPEIGNAPTQIASAPVPVPVQTTSRAPLIGVALVLLIAIVGGVVFLALRKPTDSPQVVVIERTNNGVIASSGATAAPSSEASEHPAASSVPTSSTKPSLKPAAGDPLSAAFAKRQPEIEGCFRDKAASIAGSPEISVRFSIDRDGAVQRAELSPNDLASTPLGECVLAIAKTTHFPSQTAPATFRIPLRARRAN